MTLPSSGTLTMNAINSELGRSSNSQISLDTAENGGYGAINQNSRSRPNASNPAAMSEWYGYNHNATGVIRYFEMPEVGYAGNSSTALFWLDEACRNSVNRPGRSWGATERLVETVGQSGNPFYSNSAGTTRPPAGYYAQFGSEAIYWNGSSPTRLEFCRI